MQRQVAELGVDVQDVALVVQVDEVDHVAVVRLFGLLGALVVRVAVEHRHALVRVSEVQHQRVDWLLQAKTVIHFVHVVDLQLFRRVGEV